MSVHDIFANLSQHMVQGIMFHEDMVDYYNFLNLPGYAACHCWHAASESKARRELRKWHIRHCGMLVPYHTNTGEDNIPASWYKYTQIDVSPSDIQNAVKSGLEKWVDWEKQTKALYENAYSSLLQEGHIAAACFVKDLILDVSEEYATAYQYLLNKRACSFDIGAIMADQDKDTKTFRARMSGL